MARSVLVLGGIRLRDPLSDHSLKGYSIRVSFQCAADVQENPDGPAEITVTISGSAPASEDGSFRVEVRAPGEPFEPIVVRASSPHHSESVEKQFTLSEIEGEIEFQVEGYEPFTIETRPDTVTDRITIRGRAIDSTGSAIQAGHGIVLFGVDQVQGGNSPAPRVLASGRVQAGGHFALPWTPDRFDSAFARIAGGAPIAIRLEDLGILPTRATLVVEGTLPPPPGNGTNPPPRVPEPGDLTANPAAFSQDLGGGCVNLSMPDRTIEEFAYFAVVRTSEPEVSGFTFGQRPIVPPVLVGELVNATATLEVMAQRSVPVQQLNSLQGLSLDAASAERLLRDDRPPSLRALARASWLSELDRAKDLLGATVMTAPGPNALASRTGVDQDHQIRWDYNEAKVYQAVTIAHGHILQYREVWRADGYSLGDLLSSLPLAPGQRRQVAIVDWDRRSQAVREESLEFEEELQGSLSRDRDIQEIVGSRLSEEIEAGSRNTTWGASAGFGAGLIGGAFGIFGGVSGGASGSNSNSWQDASRQFSAETMQSLRDRVSQRSSSLRDQRATVVQSVAQGETWRAETEVIANYNRCHAITVEYFQVLRHFVVTHELAHVRECLFVPFPMRSFDGERALRWRETLELFLRDNSLRPGFAALERVADQWQGWDFPESRYSEEAPESLEGELRISFVLPRPRDSEDGKYQVSEWRYYSNWIPRDTLELWTANMNAKAARERDEYFRREVAPEIAAHLVADLRFAYITSSGSTADLTLDGTLVSRYTEGLPLYVTLRPSGGLPSTKREEITAFRIQYEGGELPPDARVIVHSGKLRYRTPHLAALLFNEPRILNDLRAGDPVTISTPLTRAESRNPRQEDRDLADRLVRHLNQNLEFYLQAVWTNLDSELRFMLLDGMLIPGDAGLSVASVVENRLIGIAGNSMVFPLAPGIRLDPRIGDESAGLEELYASNPPPPLNVSIPTRGVYAEAVQGNCTACEKIDDSRYWRWSTEGLLAPPAIAEVSTERPTGTDPNVTPTPLPAPLVSIQNAPDLPNPTTISSVLGLLAKPDLFRDITGLAGTQANAQKAFNNAMTNLTAIGNDAATLAKQQLALPNTQKMLDRLQGAVKDGLLTPDQAAEFAEEAIRSVIAEPKDKDKLPTENPNVQKAVDAAVESKKAEIKITTPTETIEAKFEDTATRVGSSPQVATNQISELIDLSFHVDVLRNFTTAGPRTVVSVRIPRFSDAQVLTKHLATDPNTGVFPIDQVHSSLVSRDGEKYKIRRRLQIVFPADGADPRKIAGTGRLPVVAIIHGQHQHWAPNSTSNAPNYQGYTYLQNDLAQNGIISVSVDTNAASYIGAAYLEMRALMLLEALDRLKLLDSDKESPLFGRLDLSKVGIVGHSRAGDSVVRAALSNLSREETKRHGIKAVCSLAPSDMTGTARLLGYADDVRVFVPDQIPDTFTDGPHILSDSRLSYLVVYGGLDADVDGKDGARGPFGTGFRHYDRATCPKAMVFLHHCSHNRFNSVWKTEGSGSDESGISPSDLQTSANTPPRLLSPTEHRSLANDYIGGFFRWKLKGETNLSGLFTGTVANSVHAETSLQWSFGKDVGDSVVDIEDMENPNQGQTAARTVTNGLIDEFANITINNVKQNLRTQHQTRVLAVSPNLPANSNVLTLDFATPQDWSIYKWLLLRVTADFDLTSLTAIQNGALPQFTVELRDGQNIANLDQTNFSPPLTRPVFHDVVDLDAQGAVTNTFHVTALKLETMRVALSSFQNVDLKKVIKLQIRPAAQFATHLFFDSLQLVKEK